MKYIINIILYHIMKPNKELADTLVEKTHAIKEEERSENEQKGVQLTTNRLNELVSKTQRGMAAALKIASIAYYSSEIQKIASLDEYGANWMRDISEATYALAAFDINLRDRVILSISKSPELYNIQDIDADVRGIPY